MIEGHRGAHQQFGMNWEDSDRQAARCAPPECDKCGAYTATLCVTCANPCTDYPRIDKDDVNHWIIKWFDFVSDAHLAEAVDDLLHRVIPQRSETAAPDAGMNTKERGSK